MDLNEINGFSLQELSEINVILGKNGCGKSYLLKQIEAGLQGRNGFGKIRYISPERGGVLQYQPNIDQNISDDPNWILNERRKNQSQNFRQQSATLFRRLELLVLRRFARMHGQLGYAGDDFTQTIALLNTLLERVKLEEHETKAFKITERTTGGEATPDMLSSGKSELISLGIEFLAFAQEAAAGTENILLVDEPDVHLHPDLQDRLARFIITAVSNKPIRVVLATHSTPLLAALSEKDNTRVAFMKRGMNTLIFDSVTTIDRAILPIFGAHPLSNIFNKAPVLLIEGEDDERLWQQAIRSSVGRIRLFPCVVDGLPHFAEFEAEVNKIIDAVYDDAKAYALRDRDDQPEMIDNVGHLVRMRLSCRAAENLMLTDEVLALAQTDWPSMAEKITNWIEANKDHKYHSEMAYFEASGCGRRNADLKDIRNILVGLITNKPWEVLVGQALANIAMHGGQAGDMNLRTFLGNRVCTNLLGMVA